MVQVVAPLRIEPESAEPGGLMIFTSFRSLSAITATCLAQFAARAVHCLGQLGQEMAGTEIVDGVDGIQAQTVHMELGHPVQRVLDKEGADRRRCRARRD